ncbi:MAG: efflux RND transporter permease subunit [Myxococcales bacterium]|nr:efflux RND transporter permease subunit [Myxococcales bacterium]
MKITETAIKLRTAVMVLTAALCLGGIYAYVALPKESNPSIEIPNIVVTTLYPGASPDDVESLITQQIEQEVAGISGIDEIRSTSTEGVSTIVIEFTPDVAINEALQQVRDKVGIAKADLPTDAEEPLINEIDLSEFPIMVVNLSATYPLAQMKKVAEDIQDKIEGIPSILEVDLIGALEEEVQVDADLGRLQGYNLAFKDLIDTITRENVNLPGGSIDVGRLNYLVRVNGEFDDPLQIENLVVKAPDRKPIYVRDVAEVRRGFKDRSSYSRLRVLQRDDDGELHVVEDHGYQKVISLSVKKRAGENIIDAADAVRAAVASMDLPNGTEVLITGDQSKQVRNLVKDLENNIISGLIFVVAVLLFFLGVRNSLLVGVAIPLSMFTTFLVMLVMGQTLNFIILFSLIIALGMLVDNAVVIVENIYRFLEEGHEHFTAANEGTAEVGIAVVASTATTVAAFGPMLFWPGVIGEFMSFMPLTLIITLLCSLFVAIVINPVITGYFARVPGDTRRAASKWPRRITALTVLALGASIGFANPTTLIVLVVGTVITVVVHLLVMQRIGDFFVETGLPWAVESYRRFLETMLLREEGVRWPVFRNSFALMCFAAGFGLAVVGGILFAGLGLKPALVFLAPGGALFAIGLLGIVVHALEVVFLGGWASVKFGLGLSAVMGGTLGIMYLSPRPLEVETIAELMLLPVLITVVGLLGWPFSRRWRHFVLTDNRAKLITATLGGLFAIFGMFALAPTGVAFFPETDPNQIQVVVDAPLGTNIETTNKVASEVAGRIDALLADDANSKANTKNVLVSVGVGGDAMFGGGAARAETATISMNLVDFEERAEGSRATMERFRQQLEGLAGADIEFKRDQAGPPTGPPVNIEITGPNYKTIVDITERVKAKLQAALDAGRLKGMVDLRDNLKVGRPELRVVIDRERAAQFGLDTRKIATTVRSAINGQEAGTWRDGEDEYDITVRLREDDRQSLEAVEQLTVMHEGTQVPLVAVADTKLGSGLSSITRLDQQRVVTVMANAASGVNAQELLQKVQKELEAVQRGLPPGYTMKYTGESEDQAKSFGFLTTALGTGVALILIILIGQFNSIVSPLIIMIAVALSMIGVLLGLIVTRTPFSLFTFIGVISLAGIVVNNNIVLIDYMIQLRDRGMAKREAVIEAGATRLRPVLLTAMTTVLGLIPLTFGINIDFVGLLVEGDPDFRIGSANTQFWGPMGTTIISGLTFATFLTLVIVPVMYSAFDSLSDRIRGAFRMVHVDAEDGSTPPPAPVEPEAPAAS